MNTTISDAALPVVARYVGRTSNIYRYIAEDLAVVDAQISDEAKKPAKPEAVRLRDELRERAALESAAREVVTLIRSIPESELLALDADKHPPSSLSEAATTLQAALAATGKQQVGEALTDTYVQTVPDKCDRIVWRGHYYHLPIKKVGEVEDSASRLIDAIEGECDGLVISSETAAAIPDHVRLGDPWRDAVFSEWALTFIDPQSEVPAEILRAVINWNVRTALDPSVSSDAAALVASGKQVCEVQAVDLQQFRPMVQMYIEANEKIEHLSDVAAWAVGHGKRLLAKIDGRDAVRGMLEQE